MSVESPMSELDAINLMLRTIGEAPINTLSGTLTTDVTIAQDILQKTSHAVQSIGWQFNSECNYPLVPDVNGAITLPPNIVRVDQDTTNDSGDYDLVQRGTQLYDRKNRTAVFTSTIKAEVVLLFAFADLPPIARQYIAVKASRIFQAKVLGSETLDKFTEVDEAQARMAFEEAEGENADYTIFDSYTVYRALDRQG